jgi:hypothetical protein
MVSTHTKENFSWEKWSKFIGFKNSKLPESYDNFQKVAKNIEGAWFLKLKTFISIM